MADEVKYKVTVETGQGNTALKGIGDSFIKNTGLANQFTTAVGKIGAGAFIFNNIKSAIGGIAEDFKGLIAPGVDFNDQMKDLQSITGVTNAQLEKIGNAARQSAKDFGIDASGAVESYKLILSQLSPEIANNDVALAAMGKNAAILSKQLGGDVATATGILTTGMNQYGVSLDDPIKASETMARMMNIMSAAAKEGSAELPQIKNALEQAGMMAKSQNVPFNELNAAIQVLDKAGKKGAEGGVAIRNALAVLSEGKFMGAAQQKMLQAAGIDVKALADKSLSFSQRLQLLSPLLKDTSAMTLLFGKENAAAGIALVQGAGTIEDLSKKITGTNSAVEMADIKMGSWREQMARVNAKLKDWQISIFNATDGLQGWIQMGGSGLQMMSSFGGAVTAAGMIADTRFGGAMKRAAVSTLGFVKTVALGTWNVIRSGVVMGAQAVVAVGSYVGSLIVATAAQWGLNAAMYANPIGIVVLGIMAAVAAVGILIYWWDEIWDAIKSFTAWVWEHSPFAIFVDVVDNIFPGFKQAFVDLWNWIKKKFTDLIDWFKDTWKSIKGVFGFDSEDTKPATQEQAAAVEQAVTKAVEGIDIPVTVTDKTGPLDKYDPHAKKDKSSKTAKEMSSNITGGGSKPTTINLTIHKLQDQVVIHTTNLEMGAKDAGKKVVELLLQAINSVNGEMATA